MRQTKWCQVEIKLLAGAEPWLLVRHAGKCFRIPATVEAGELLRGALEGWTQRPKAKQAEATVRVPLDEWMRLTIENVSLVSSALEVPPPL